MLLNLPIISPDLLRMLSLISMVMKLFYDAYFPSESLGPTLKADGLKINDLLDAILPLFALIFFDKPISMMSPVKGDKTNPNVEKNYLEIINKHSRQGIIIDKLERFDFYSKSKSAFAIVATGDTEKYANIILKKGVTPS